MLCRLKPFKREKGTTRVLKNLTKFPAKRLRRSLFLIKPQAYSKFFTGLLSPVKISSKNVSIFLKTSLNYLKYKLNF